MSSRGILNLAMLAVVGVLAWFAIGGDQPDRDSPRSALSTLDTASITRIRLRREGAESIELVREDGVWAMRTPLLFPADGFLVEALLGMLRASAKQLPVAPGDDAGFGLSPPRAELTVNDTTLAIGATDPIAQQRYVAIADRVYLIEDAWYSHLFSSPARYLDPRPAGNHGVPHAIQTPHMAWERKDGRWRRTPGNPALGADDAQALAERWANARAVLVDDLDPDAPWSGEVVLRFASRLAPLTLRIARNGEVVLLGREDPPLQYQFTKRQAARLLSDQQPE